MNPVTCNPKPLLATLTALVLLSACAAPAATPTAGVTATVRPAPTAGPSPTPPPGQIRRATVAGTWYPGDPDELAQTVDSLLAAVQPVDGAPIGLVVPHAGYAYSAPVAAYGFRQLAQGEYDVAVIIAADHQPPISNPISVWAEGGFETPLGVVPVDVELAQALIAADPRITFDPAAHEGEHMIEIELPFLQRVCPQCSIVPILMGGDDDETVQALANALVQVLAGKKAVVIASSDLSHYPSYDDALAVDGATLTAIEAFDPALVRETIDGLMAAGYPNLATCACGEAPILVTMQVAQGLGADTATILHYANSADVSGDRSQVVGYGAVMFWRYQPPELDEGARAFLLTLARDSIAARLGGESLPDPSVEDAELLRPLGAFVTLKIDGELRGCIGNLTASGPLYQIVQQMAQAAAFEDPRFPPLAAEELEQVTIEISVLSPMRRITSTDEIEIGRDGLYLIKGANRGVFLPQVPVEQGWDLPQYLDNLCEKAWLSAGCWQEGATLYTFTAEVFAEGE
jgi:AmmeMemoRadiSam system protein B/AmmeMemoRadiSam system protein A